MAELWGWVLVGWTVATYLLAVYVGALIGARNPKKFIWSSRVLAATGQDLLSAAGKLAQRGK